MECKYEKLIFSKNSQENIWRAIFLTYQHMRLTYFTDRPDVTRQIWCKWLRGTVNNTQLTRRNSEEETFFDKRIEKDSTFSANTEINTEDVSA